MREMKLSERGLYRYYRTDFKPAFNRCFEVKENADGVCVSDVLLRRDPTWMGGRGIAAAPAAALFAETGYRDNRTRPYVHRPFGRYLDERDFYFMALSCGIYAAQTIIHSLDDEEQKHIDRVFSDISFPVFEGVNKRFYELPEFLKYSGFERFIDFKAGVETLREALLMAMPLIAEKLVRHFSGYGDQLYFEEQLREIFRTGLLLLTITRFPQGLSDTDFTSEAYWHYLKYRFTPQFAKYFDLSLGDYPIVLFMPDRHNGRWGDEKPGDNAQENFLFSAIVLYMMIAQQAVLKYVPQVQADFHRCTDWPQLCSGPGAGPFLHPLGMLEEARLLPRKSETLLLVEAIDVVFKIMHQRFCTVVNGKGKASIFDKDAHRRFLQAFKGYGNTRLRGEVKKYAEEQMARIRELLVAWATSPDKNMWTLLSNHNTPIQMEIK